GVEQDFHGQGGFLQTGWDAGSPSPAAVWVLNCEQPGDCPPGGFAVHHMEVAVSGQDAGGAVGRVLVAGGVLVAEPERQPGTVGALLLREISQAALDGGAKSMRRAVQRDPGVQGPNGV